jgi:hypothetical protein
VAFDSTIILWCIAAPAAIAVTAVIASRRTPPRLTHLVVAAGWWLATVAALAATQGWQWWSDEAWCRAVWPILAWAVLIAGSATDAGCQAGEQNRSPSWRWILAGVLACLTALVAMPTGEEWSDTFEIQPVWMCAVATSCLLNGFSLECLARRGAQRWCLFVALAGLGGPLALAVSTYASLAQWTLSLIAATFAVACLGIFPRFAYAWVIVFPISAGAAGIVAAARFYSYEEHSVWVYAAMLYGPTLVALIDRTIVGRPTWLRVVTAGSVSIALVGFCLWSVLLS